MKDHNENLKGIGAERKIDGEKSTSRTAAAIPSSNLLDPGYENSDPDMITENRVNMENAEQVQDSKELNSKSNTSLKGRSEAGN